MAAKIYMVIGCPGSGKSWVCEQLRDCFDYVPHDDYAMGVKGTSLYIEAIIAMHRYARKPLLIETPFSISQIKDPLEAKGFHINPVFIQEHPDVIRKRYRARGSGDLPAGHLSRQKTHKERADKWQSFQGTSNEVLAYLKNAAPPAKLESYPWQH